MKDYHKKKLGHPRQYDLQSMTQNLQSLLQTQTVDNSNNKSSKSLLSRNSNVSQLTRNKSEERHKIANIRLDNYIKQAKCLLDDNRFIHDHSQSIGGTCKSKADKIWESKESKEFSKTRQTSSIL